MKVNFFETFAIEENTIISVSCILNWKSGNVYEKLILDKIDFIILL